MTPLIRPAILLPAHYGIISIIPCIIARIPLLLHREYTAFNRIFSSNN